MINFDVNIDVVVDDDDDQVETAVDDSQESLKRRAKEAYDAEDYKLALELYGQCVHLHVDEESYNLINNLIVICNYVEYNDARKTSDATTNR